MDYSQLGNKKRKRSPHATRVRNKVGLLIMRVVFAVVLIGGFALVGAGLGVYIGILENSPELDMSALGPVSMRSFDVTDSASTPYMTTFIVCAETGEERLRIHGGENFVFAHITQMPEHLIHAFVAIEDERFFEHNGVDPRGIARAIWVATQPDRAPEGASTITQQLIKNMLGVTRNNMISKLQEQYLAINFERELVAAFDELGYEDPRREAKYYILESYLNIINLGQTNKGVASAAWFYYGVELSELSIVQSATIAAITQNPSRFPPDRRPRDNWRRTKHVLENMLRLGFITDEEYEEAIQERQYINPDTGEPMYDEDGEPIMIGLVYDTIFRLEGGGTRPLISPFDCFTDALFAQVRDDLMEQYGLNAEQASNRIYNTGLTIESTQNMEIQAIVDAAFLDDSLWPGEGVGYSIEVTHYITVYDTFTQQRRGYEDQRIVANMAEAEAHIQSLHDRWLTETDEIVDELSFFVPQPQGAFVLIDQYTGHVLAIRGIRGEKQGNRAFNRAYDAMRSPGSQMKPLVPFTPLIELNVLQPASVIDDIPFHLASATGAGWRPGNHWGSTFRGLTTVRNAIYTSANVVSARAAADPSIPHAGVPTMVRYLELMGITTIHPHDGAAMVLGGMTNGLRLIELAGAYATLANHGEYNRPVLYTVVRDHEGNILLENPYNPRRVVSTSTAFLMTSMMEDTVQRGTGTRANWTTGSGLRGQIPIAGKTGTSQRNSDLGFVGYTPYYTAAIWFGNDNHQPMHRRTNEFHTPLWRHIMEEIHINLPPRSFERPPGVVSATACMDSGHLPTELCRSDPRGRRDRGDVFAVGMVPTETCRVHQQFTYCTESNLLASVSCPEWAVVTRIGIVRPIPIDGVEGTVADRYLEFPIGVRQGLTCATCVGGFLQNPAESEWIFNMDTGQWIQNPNFNPNTPPDFSSGFDDIFSPMPLLPTPTPTPIPTPPPQNTWPGLGDADEPEETPPPFVNTVTVPGLE